MAEHMQEEADLEALKRWWDENGKGIAAAVVMAVLGTVGPGQQRPVSAPNLLRWRHAFLQDADPLTLCRLQRAQEFERACVAARLLKLRFISSAASTCV